MPAPTPDELLEYFEALIAEHQTEGQFAVFEWDYLKTKGFRNFRTTSPAIETRMQALLDGGKLASVEIHSSGHIYFDRAKFPGMRAFYFQYRDPRYYRPEWGFITSTRPKDMENVWRDGTRELYTTAPHREAMITHFLEVVRQEKEDEKAKEEAEEARLWDHLEDAFPGARGLLGDLEAALEGGGRWAEVSTGMHQIRDKVYPHISIDTRSTEQAVKLLTIIRRGLAEGES